MKKILSFLAGLLMVSGAANAAPAPSGKKVLPEKIHAEVKKLSARADQLAKAGNFGDAILLYWDAWDLLPEPKQDWSAALWLLTAIGDANFLNKDYVACRDNLSFAMRVPGAVGNPFLHLRLGQCQFELGNMDRAADELARAYIPEGRGIFNHDDPKYLDFIKSKLKPPPAGWPAGW